MMILFDLCNSSGTLRIFLFLKILFQIVCIIVPLILIYNISVSLFKTVISGKDLNVNSMQIFKSLVAGLIVFLLPTVMSFVFENLYDVDTTEISMCFVNASLDNVKRYVDAEKSGRDEDKNILKEQLAQEFKESRIKEEKERERLKAEREAIQRQKEEEERKKREEEERRRQEEEERNNQNNGGGGTSPGSSDVVVTGGTANIIIGDSRTVGMCMIVAGGGNACSFSNGGAYTNGNDIYIAQGSMSYSWFINTAVPAANNIINNNPNTKFNIYSLMGCNMLLYDINKYIPKYIELANGSWNGHNLILVSVNPVDEAKEAQYGYSTKTTDIISFNTQLKNGTSGVSNIKYCDTYNSVVGDLVTTDGLHYGASTYRQIYNSMNACSN